MIPVLFDSNEKVFTSNGLGRLTDCISCLVTEERNGIYECEFTYPITGVNYDLIQEGNIVVTSHDEQKDRQPFVIYRISRPISGVVTVNAHHISYELANVIIAPFTAYSVASAFNDIENNSMTSNPFTFWTDKTSAGSIDIKVPTSCKSILGGMKGSILDSFGGGEYEWDNYTVKLYANRGSNNGVTIRYGKNLADVVAERDVLGIYNAVIPYWSDGENTVVYGGIVVGNGGILKSATWTDENNVQIKDEHGTNIDFAYYIQQVSVMDLSSKFDDQPTVDELETMAQTILNSNQPWIPKDNIKVDFVALWQTEEYANIAPLERVRLCDTVSIYYPELGVDATSKVIKVVWNALLERYDSVELGEAKASFAEVIQAETDVKLEDVPNISMMEEAINNATSLITGGLGGHICFLYDANGKPTDMLVMDTEDVSTAVHVLRINVNGIGFSSTGVSGTYSSAWTLDGQFVADFITAGTMSANRIQGGILTLGGNNNGNGVLVMNNSSGNEIGRWSNNGLTQNYQNVYTYISNAAVPSSTMSTGDIYTTIYPGFEVTYNQSQNENVYAVVPRNGSVYETIWGTTEARKYMVAGNKSAGEWIWESEIALQTYYMKHFAHWKSGIGKNECHLIVKPKEYYGLGENVGGSVTVNTTYPGFLIDATNKYVDIYAGNARLKIHGDCSVEATESFHIGKLSSTAYPYIDCTSGGYFTIAPTSGIYLRYDGTNWKTQAGTIAIQGSSAKRYKHDITDEISEELDPHKLYELPMKQFVFNDDCETWEYQDMKGRTLPGFIAEDVAEIYSSAVIRNTDGDIENWDVRRIVPGMLKLIQEQHDEIEDLKTRIAKLETLVESLMR